MCDKCGDDIAKFVNESKVVVVQKMRDMIMENHILPMGEEITKLKSLNEELVKRNERLTEALEFFVCQNGFPFGDFADIAGMDLKTVVARFKAIQEALTQDSAKRGG